MSNCKLDHTHEDVKNKYESQTSFLPTELHPLFAQFFTKEHTQETLNKMFHLLKKYDLSSEVEQMERNEQMKVLLKNS